MPFWATRIGTPRTLAVEFPFGHTLGMPGSTAVQHHIIDEALRVLETAESPDALVESTAVFPPTDLPPHKLWHPPEPAPIIAMLGPQIRKMVRNQRNK